jgi:multisubunit Na+/H+ antiporter MnhB subunit
MSITDRLYVAAESAISLALVGASRPDGAMRLVIVFCAPLLLVVFAHGRRYLF